MSNDDKKMQKRRSAIEPIIGHLKNFGRMGRNYLKGFVGDIVNPLISAVGLNLRRIGNILKELRDKHFNYEPTKEDDNLIEVNIEGSGFSIAFKYVTNDTNASHTIQGLVLNYSMNDRR